MSDAADNAYEQQNDQLPKDVPSGADNDNDYKSRTGQSHIPVQSDDAPVEDPIDPNAADSDAQLEKDDKEAIDSDNIIDERTRGATKSYKEPGDDEGLPGPEDGTSQGRQ